MTSDDWTTRASCRPGSDYHGYAMWDLPDDPARDGLQPAPLTDAHHIAILICDTVCPVQDACLRDALDTQAQGVIRAGRAMHNPWEIGTCTRCGTRYLRATTHGTRSRYCSRACIPHRTPASTAVAA